MTLYQADWALAALTLQLGKSPLLQLPVQSFPQLGDQIWGLVLPTHPDGSDPVFLSLSSEQGPVDVYGPDGRSLAQLTPGGPPVEVNGLPIRVADVLPASGILLKRDPGVPLVYGGFAVALLGGGLSLVATRQLWAIAESPAGRLHVAGLCNRNLTAFAAELPILLAGVGASRADQQAWRVPWLTRTTMWTLPRGLKSASSCIQIGSQAATRSSMMRLAASSWEMALSR